MKDNLLNKKIFWFSFLKISWKCYCNVVLVYCCPTLMSVWLFSFYEWFGRLLWSLRVYDYFLNLSLKYNSFTGRYMSQELTGPDHRYTVGLFKCSFRSSFTSGTFSYLLIIFIIFLNINCILLFFFMVFRWM